jgi:sugar phosphate isomerase/epimerase
MSKHPPIALQLYSVREDCARDLPGVLKAVAKMGYKGVEFAGYHKFDAKTLRKMLDDNGLKAAGAHIGIETMLGSDLDATIAFHKEIGNHLLIVPGLSGKYTESAQAWQDTARTMNEIAAKLKPHGMRTGYHNHTHEFKPVAGSDKLPWDLFFGGTDKSVVMQFDTGNALDGGKDAMPFLKAYPGRAASVHLKEHSDKKKDALLGEGDVPFAAILKELEKQNATDWLIVEQESYPVSPLESVERSLRNLERILG